MKYLLISIAFCAMIYCTGKDDTVIEDEGFGLVSTSIDSLITEPLVVDSISISVTNCCDAYPNTPVIISWNVPGATQLVLIDDRHERIVAVGSQGTYNAYVIDKVELRNQDGNTLKSKVISDCCTRKYQIKANDFIYYLEDGNYTIHKMMGFDFDLRWDKKVVGAKTTKQQSHLGKGTFIVVWTAPNRSYRTFDVVRIY